MDTRVLNEQRLEAAAQIKEAESAVWPPEPCSISDKVKCVPAKRVKQRRAELDSTAKRHVRSNTLSQRGAVSPSSWMTIARRRRAPARRWNRQSPVSAARAAIEAARTSIIQAQTRVEAAQATERRILADIDDSELKAPAMAAFSIASLRPRRSHGRRWRVLNMVDLADI